MMVILEGHRDIQELRVDSDGHLQIDVLSGGGGTEYSEDVATPGTIAGLAFLLGVFLFIVDQILNFVMQIVL